MQAWILSSDSAMADFLAYVARKAGLRLRFRSAAPSLDELEENEHPDLILLSLEEVHTAVSVIQILRSSFQAPLLAIGEDLRDRDMAALLRAGADLVLRSPVDPNLLCAYIAALLRRVRSPVAWALPTLEIGRVRLNPANHTVQRDEGPPVRLTPLEFRLLHLLMSYPGHVLPTETIVDRVWGYGEAGSKELVRGLVSRLRAKIEPDTAHPQFIHTVPGVGYLIEPPND